MKAISIFPPYADAIWFEEKTIEVRTWETTHRGDLLICTTKDKVHGFIPGHALCVATLKNVRPFTKKDCKAAGVDPRDFREGLYAWELSNIRTINPIPVRGMPGLYEVDDDLIEYISDPDDDEERSKKIWGRLMK